MADVQDLAPRMPRAGTAVDQFHLGQDRIADRFERLREQRRADRLRRLAAAERQRAAVVGQNGGVRQPAAGQRRDAVVQRSFEKLTSVELGFQPERALLVITPVVVWAITAAATSAAARVAMIT